MFQSHSFLVCRWVGWRAGLWAGGLALAIGGWRRVVCCCSSRCSYSVFGCVPMEKADRTLFQICRHRPDLARSGASLAKLWRSPVDMFPDQVDSGPIPVEVAPPKSNPIPVEIPKGWSDLAHMRPRSPSLSRCRVEFGRNRSIQAQLRSNPTHRHQPRIGRPNLAEVDRVRPELGRKQVNVWPTSRQVCPDIDRS